MIIMSWIRDGITVYLSNYGKPSKKHEKEAIRLLEALGDELSKVDAICRNLRYYALFVDWGEGKLKHSGFFGEFHYTLNKIKTFYDDRRDLIFGYLNDFEHHSVAKIKEHLIDIIEEHEKDGIFNYWGLPEEKRKELDKS